MVSAESRAPELVALQLLPPFTLMLLSKVNKGRQTHV